MSKRSFSRKAKIAAAHSKVRNYKANGDAITYYDETTGYKHKKNARTHKFAIEGQWWNPPSDSGNTHQANVDFTIDLVDEVITGPNIPGWKDKIRQGIGVVTSLTGRRQTLQVDSSGEVSSQLTIDVGSADVNYGALGLMNFSMPTAPSEPSATATQLAQQRLLQSYISQVQTFSGGKFLAEIKDTIELVLHPVHSVYKATYEFAGVVKGLGKVYKHRPKTAAALLSESWLAFSFGVKPAIQDANDAAKALNVIKQSQRHDIRYVKGEGKDRDHTESVATNTLYGGSTFHANVFTTYESSVRLEGAFRQAPVGTGNLLSEFGLSVFDIAPSIWEGIPWSFFVDYFANVGESLDALRYISVDQAWLINSVRNRVTRTVVPFPFQGLPPPERQYYLSGSGRVTGTDTMVSRRETSFLAQAPSFHFKLPGTNASRLLNIVSLIGVINDSKWGTRL